MDMGESCDQLRNSHVIPSVAEESEMPALDSISRFLDSSATLGMTSFNKFRRSGGAGRAGGAETAAGRTVYPFPLQQRGPAGYSEQAADYSGAEDDRRGRQAVKDYRAKG